MAFARAATAGTRTLKVRFPLALRRPPTLKLWRTPSSQKCAILRWQGSDTNLLLLPDFLDCLQSSLSAFTIFRIQAQSQKDMKRPLKILQNATCTLHSESF